ncbi:MAG: hypothetical protein K2K48_00830, partial [Anaeroplasmataceae bacterium]|nr:hypothetical protein [Anaeroplasmataceae bacterium]
NAEAEIARIKAENAAELAKIKAEAEIAKVKAELAAQAQAQQAPYGHGMPSSNVDDYFRLRQYEERLRSMERELQEQKMASMVREENQRARKELEEASRIQQQQEDLRYLQELQDLEVQRRQELTIEPEIPNPAASGGFEQERLRLLQEQLHQKQIENQLLQEQYQQKTNMNSKM